MLELFKPLQVLNNRRNPLIFNELGQPFSGNKSLRPFIIFYDSVDHSYYYIKARDAYKKSGELKETEKGEILIYGTGDETTTLYKHSYVDCSQIFKIDADLMKMCIDTNCELYKNTFKLSKENKDKILNKINECCDTVPQYLSIIEICLDSQGTFGKSLYLCEEKYENVCLKCDNDIYNADDIDLVDFISSKDSKFSFQRERYNNAIKFIKIFQKEYFYIEYKTTDYDKKYYKSYQNKEFERGR